VVEVPFRADDTYGGRDQVQFVLGAGVDDVTMQTYAGRLRIIEDEPAPTFELSAARPRARYGDPLRFVVEASAPMTFGTFVALRLVRVPDRRPVRTDDVPRRWLERQGADAEPGRALADVLRSVGGYIDRGRRRAVLEIPTRIRRAEQGLRTLGVELRARGRTQRVTVRVR
jgi:hypothetical protein